MLMFDLDDTVLSFSIGTDDLWERVLSGYPALLGPLGARQLAHTVEAVISPSYWGDPERAARGRLDMVTARREVLRRAVDHHRLAVDDRTVFAAADAFTWEKEEAVAPLGDSISVLDQLIGREVRLGVVTNGSADFQRRKLRRYDLERRFEVVLIEGEWGVGKPHPSIFEAALRQARVGAEQAWMVGDNYEADVVGAAAVGIGGVWVAHGRKPPAHAVRPQRIVEHIRELLA
jgi:putative hydrolase of the HAD superfamily